MQIHCDTHVFVWLHAGELEQLSDLARSRIEECELVMSPIAELELTYLCEIGRTTAPGSAVFADLAERIGVVRSATSFAAVVAAAAPLSWTRDPFDRLIVGDADASACDLLTRDSRLLDRYSRAVW